MSLQSSLSIAISGLANVNRQLAVVSQNIANAETPGYTRKAREQQAVAHGGIEMGVRTGSQTRVMDEGLRADLARREAVLANLSARESLLRTIEAAHGASAQADSLGNLVGELQDSFIALQSNPASAGQQSAVISAADALARRINDVAGTVNTARQSAQDGIVDGVGRLNDALVAIASLTTQIRAAAATGRDSADLEDLRDAQMAIAATLVDARFVKQADGGVIGFTASGLTLPLDGRPPFAATGAVIGPQSWSGGGGIPAITLNGTDVTALLRGGEIGGLIEMRDTTLPAWQAQLDEFAQKLAWRFEQQGLRLFVQPGATDPVPDPDGTLPAPQTPYVGFAQTIAVNPAVAANPSLVRDGTHALSTLAGDLLDFTPNPAGGPQAFTGLLDRIVDYVFGAEAAAGVPHTPFATAAQGPAGTIVLSDPAQVGLGTFAANLTAAQTADRAALTTQIEREGAVRDLIRQRLTDLSGVNVDREMATMIRLQTSYAAGARLIAAVQDMWDALLASVR